MKIAMMIMMMCSACAVADQGSRDRETAVQGLNCDPCDPDNPTDTVMQQTISYGLAQYVGASYDGGSCSNTPPVGTTCNATFDACTDYGCGTYVVVCDRGSCYFTWQ